jgi:hypothetical protein
MGFLSRSVSMMRYRVKGEIEGAFWDAIDNGVKLGSFKPVDSPGSEIGFGWTSIDDFTDTGFSGASYVRGNYVALSLRIDDVRVPPRILEMEYKKQSLALLKELGARRLSSGQRRDLKERIKETLKKQVFPSIQVFDVVWDTSTSVVYFASLSVKSRERIEDHFKKCFGLSLIPLLAYIRAEEMVDSEALRQALAQLKHCSMMP